MCQGRSMLVILHYGVLILRIVSKDKEVSIVRNKVVGCGFYFYLLLCFAIVAVDYVDIIRFGGETVATYYAVILYNEIV